MQVKTNYQQLFSLISVFFFWGFVASSNDILIPVFKKTFQLTQGQSQLVSLAFYIAYTVGSLIYTSISLFIKQDIINKIGYKNGLALGLVISALGTLLFFPAANLVSFPLMLSALFIVAMGFSLQQIVANPLAISLGPIETGAQRLTLAGAINNLGTTIGPLIVSYAIFGSNSSNSQDMNIQAVKIPYLILGLAFLIAASLLKISSVPDKPAAIDQASSLSKNERSSALKYPQLVLGMIAIFVYVGVEVSTASNLPAYMEKNLGFLTKDVAPYISLYWASLMIGRWSGAVEALSGKISTQKILKFILPYIAFAIFLIVNAIAKNNLSPFYIYGLIICILILADLVSRGNPVRMLLLFSILGIISLSIGMATNGLVSVYAFISVGLFCSTLWPCIFALAISGLGKHTSQGSSFLIMMIMGGGIISWLQGFVADNTNIHFSYIVGVICFAYLAFYAIIVAKILKKQGIYFSKKIEAGH
ncbi:MAG: MFS transporter [Bacteroidota bacterium]|jgi:FHS family L-fucose permease-like MFS transporter